ncbi:MAG: MoaD/ThiS family protein [Candidatus Kapaibacterium sp.]
MTILYFGLARDHAGISSEEISARESITLEMLWTMLIDQHPSLELSRRVSRVAVDMEYVNDGAMIPPNAEIAIIPPVAGG